MGRAKGSDTSEVAVRRGVSQGMNTVELAQALGISKHEGPLAYVNDEAVSRIAEQLKASESSNPYKPASWDETLFWNSEGTLEERSQFFAIGNSINFRFWELDDGKVHRSNGVIDGKTFGGAMYMWRALKASLDKGVPILDASFLANLSEDDFDIIFTDDNGNNPLRVGDEERITNLRNLGSLLQEKWGGQFLNVAKASNGSLVKFAKLSRGFRAFDDPVYKLTMLNAIMHTGANVNSFSDEPLPAIDYHLIRHAVRQGMVVTSEIVGDKLKENVLLDPDEARELRQASLDAYLQLSQETGISGEVLDNKYWFNRNNCGDPPVCVDPATERECPFLDACERHTGYGLPLEMTRYY